MIDVSKRIEGLSASKRALLARKLATTRATASRLRITPQQREAGTFPLSFTQERLWFLDQLLPDSPLYIMAGAAHLVGPLDMSALMRSINGVVRRHEALCINIASVDGRPAPVVATERTIIPREIDLRHLPQVERMPEAQRLMAEEARRVFDLAGEPLLRAMALRLADEEHLVLLTMHHIVSDGWSTKILFQEIAALYEAFTAGKPSPLPDLPIQYADYAIWQRQRLAGDVLHAQLAYWKRQLEGAPTILELPADHPRPATPSSRGARHALNLPPPLTQALKDLSRREGVTPFMTLLAAFKTLLYRYTGQKDVLVGTPIAGRAYPEIERLIGCFLNMLVLRSDLSGNPTFRELLGHVRSVALDAYAHQDIPFEKLVDELALARNTSYSPLYQVAFSYEDSPTTAVVMRDLTLTFAEINTGTAKVDLSLELTDEPEGLAGWFEYATDLFEPATVARIAQHFQTLLEHISANPELRLAEAPFMTAAERRQVLVAWNATEAAYPLERCAHELFEAQAQRTPDAIAVVMGDRRITYGELSRRSNQLAHELRRLGVGPEVFVGLSVERSLEMVVGVFGILKAGGVYVPLDPGYPAERLAYMLEDTRPLVLLTTTTDHRPPTTPSTGLRAGDHREGERGRGGEGDTSRSPSSILHPLSSILSDTPSPLHPFTPSGRSVVYLDTDWNRIAGRPDNMPQSDMSADNLAYVIYTSGSTGRPKGVVVAHRELVNHTCAFIDNHGLDAGDRVLQFISLSFDASAATLFPSLLIGATLVLPETPSTELTRDTLQRLCEGHHVTVMHLPASFWHQWVDDLVAAGAPPPTRLKVVLVGGEKPSLEKLHAWTRLAERPMKFLNAYGPTEAVITATIYETQCTPEALRELSRIPTGRPLANKQIYLLDAQMQPVPPGVPGEVYVGGIGLARGYLNHPDLTAERFIPNPFATTDDRRPTTDDGVAASGGRWSVVGGRLYKTGDLARWLPDGAIEYVGRIDAQVKVRGFRIELGEIEAALAHHPAVLENVVVVREDMPGVRRLVAYVVPKIEDRGLKIEDSQVVANQKLSSILYPPSSDLRAFLKDRLPDYMVPAAFVFLDALPLTAHGKVDQRALPAPDRSGADRGAGFAAPRTPAEEQLAAIWGALLGLEQVGIHDNFFEIGGDSILSIQIVARANQAGLRLTAQQIFQHQTIAELAAVAGSAPLVRAEQGLVHGSAPLTPIQRWFFEQHLPNPHHWNQAVLLRTRPAPGESLNPARLEQALQTLLSHHDALRLRFTPVSDGWQQTTAAPGAAVPFTCFDVSALSDTQRQQTIAATGAQLQAGLHITEGPLLRAAYFDAGPGAQSHLLIVAHHLVVDGVSWRILVEDLQTAYRQLGCGEPVRLPPKTTAFIHWAERLATYAQSADLARDRDYWLAPIPAEAARLPQDHAQGHNTEASARSILVSLTPQETQALLQQAPAAYHTQINDMLLTALAQALAPWSGSRALLVNLEGHGREDLFADIDLSRTVGWYTTSFPVLLELPDSGGPGQALSMVKERLRAIPMRGMSYGLLRYLDERPETAARLRERPQPAISFNYLGQIDQGAGADALFEFTAAPFGPLHDPAGQRSHSIEINSMIAAGRLQLDWTYSQELYRTASIDALAERFLAALRALIAHCTSPETGGYTPSDFPEVALSQEQLDSVLAEIDLGAWED